MRARGIGEPGGAGGAGRALSASLTGSPWGGAAALLHLAAPPRAYGIVRRPSAFGDRCAPPVAPDPPTALTGHGAARRSVAPLIRASSDGRSRPLGEAPFSRSEDSSRTPSPAMIAGGDRS